MIFLMLRLSPIPMALVATRYGEIFWLNFLAYYLRHYGGKRPYTIATLHGLLLLVAYDLGY